eukprot:1180181-Prorocentrum_minimum.AAC.12
MSHLVVLEHLEVLLAELDGVDIGLLEAGEDPLHLGPDVLELGERHLHLRLLLRAVDDLAHLVLKLEQLQREQVVQLELVVNDKVHAGGLHEHVPVPLAHVRGAQVRHQRDGGQKVLHARVCAEVAVRLADLLGQALHLLDVLLGVVLHHVRLDVRPERLAPVAELHLHQHARVPHVLAQDELLARLLNQLVHRLHHLRELEHVRQVLQVRRLLLQSGHLLVGLVDHREGRGVPRGEREKRLLGKGDAELLHLFEEDVDVGLDALTLRRLDRGHRVLRRGGEHLDVRPLQSHLLQTLLVLGHVHLVPGEHVQHLQLLQTRRQGANPDQRINPRSARSQREPPP